MIPSLLEKIINPELKAFAFRVYNVFKTTVLPIVLGMILIRLQNAGSFEGLFEGKFWLDILYSVVITLVGSAVAGLEKVTRMSD